MSAKKATKTTNVVATLYEGAFDITFDCAGADLCKFTLCEIMPPGPDSECCYRDHGACMCPPAKQAALETLKNRLVKELKEMADAAD
jgi:hypothetical protein